MKAAHAPRPAPSAPSPAGLPASGVNLEVVPEVIPDDRWEGESQVRYQRCGARGGVWAELGARPSAACPAPGPLHRLSGHRVFTEAIGVKGVIRALIQYVQC